MNELSLQQIQTETLKNLKKLDSICKKLNIHYYLAYGTLLGAIRHNGFIPWDDDIDVMLFRKDLNTLIEYFNQHLEELLPLKICTRKNTKNYSASIPRLINSDFVYESSYSYEKKYELGTFIDLYPLDNATDSEKECHSLGKKVRKLNKLYIIYINPNNGKKGLKKIVRYTISFALHLLWGNHFDFDKYTEKLVNKKTNDNNKYVSILYDRTKNNCCDAYPRDYFEKPLLHAFEDSYFYIPKDYDKILRQLYGSYMELPPEKERVPHHNYKIYMTGGVQT